LSISADGYEDLRAAIVSGELLPGERLLEEDLSARLGLGRAAVRMALVLPGRSNHSFAEHTTIVEAIAAHDPDAAENAMQHHLLRVAEALRTYQAVAPSDATAVRAVQD
jgi:DNA-binding GntR family transcriptional regulator